MLYMCTYVGHSGVDLVIWGVGLWGWNWVRGNRILNEGRERYSFFVLAVLGGFEDNGGGWVDLFQHTLPIDKNFNKFVEYHC